MLHVQDLLACHTHRDTFVEHYSAPFIDPLKELPGGVLSPLTLFHSVITFILQNEMNEHVGNK